MLINAFLLLGSLLAIIAVVALPVSYAPPVVAVWLAWAIILLILKKKGAQKDDKDLSVFDKMRVNDERKIFANFISGFEQQDEWLEKRKGVLAEFSESYVSLGEDMDRAMSSNFEKANNYMRACDYDDRDSVQKFTNKIGGLYKQNEAIVDKINDLIEQLAEVENTAEDVDTSHIDDILESLKQMTSQQ